MNVLGRLIVVLLAIGAFSVGVVWPAFAQIRVEVAAPPVEAKPGEFVTVVFVVFNEGSTDEIVSLNFEFPTGISALGAPQALTVAAGSSESVFLTVLVSQRAISGENRITITASSNANPALTGSDVALLTVLQVPGLAVQAPASVNADPDGLCCPSSSSTRATPWTRWR